MNANGMNVVEVYPAADRSFYMGRSRQALNLCRGNDGELGHRIEEWKLEACNLAQSAHWRHRGPARGEKNLRMAPRARPGRPEDEMAAALQGGEVVDQLEHHWRIGVRFGRNDQ